MTRRPVRLTLLLLFLAAMGAAAYLFWIAEQDGRSADQSARGFEAGAYTAAATVADLHSAQQAYVAAGQGSDFWFARTTTLLTDLKSRVTVLRSEASSPQAASAFDDVLGILQDFEQMDGRAREYTRSHQLMLASDLIFSDGVDLARKLTAGIVQARTAEASARDLAAAALQRREVFSLGAAAAASTAIVLLLIPVGARPEEPARLTLRTAEPARPAAPPLAAQPAAADLSLASLDEGWAPARRTAPKPGAKAAPTAPPVAPAASTPVLVAPPPKPAIDLAAVSAVCNDLARIVDTRTLPSLLERAGQVLDAAGIVLWVADPDARELTPIVTHGYPANVVTRLGTIPRDAENATAAAFRTGLLQTVKADDISNGAIAAPLLTGSGCAGVMAAEVRNGGERQDAVLAAAGIFAAQLATLVGPPSSRAKAEAAG